MMFRLALSLSLALLFVWSIPGTTALRNLLLVSAIATVSISAWREGWRPGIRGSALPLVLFAAMTAWLFLQALLLAPEPAWALAELRGQWLPAVAALLLGLMLGSRAIRDAANDAGIVQTGVALALTLLVAIPTVLMVWAGGVGGSFSGREIPLVDGKLEMSYAVSLLLAYLLADAYARYSGRQQLTLASVPVLLLAAATTLACSYLSGARNGVVGIGFLSASLLVLLAVDRSSPLGIGGRRRTLWSMLAIVLVAAGLAAASVASDPRWAILGKTIQAAWDIDRNPQWIDLQKNGSPRYEYTMTSPLAGTIHFTFMRCKETTVSYKTTAPGDLARDADSLFAIETVAGQPWTCVNAAVSGPLRRILVGDGDRVGVGQPVAVIDREVDSSAYLRIAFIRGGLRLIGEHPLGIGYGRNAFAHAVKRHFPEARLGHAHSGWIDLGIGGGLPALLLWAGFLGVLLWRGITTFIASHNPHALVLFFLATGYAGRMALDSVARDHMLQMFMFLAGLLLALTAGQRTEERQ